MSIGEELKSVDIGELERAYKGLVRRVLMGPEEARAMADGVTDDYPDLANAIEHIKAHDTAASCTEEIAEARAFGAIRLASLLREIDINRRIER